MGEILELPKIHYSLLCHDCEGELWQIVWPCRIEDDWYIKCGNCGSAFNHGIITDGLDKTVDHG